MFVVIFLTAHVYISRQSSHKYRALLFFHILIHNKLILERRNADCFS